MNGERLKLVTSFDELRAGDYTEVRGCRNCGATHRGLLTSRRVIPTSGERAWRYLPIPASHGDKKKPCVGESTVAQRRLYLVGTGLEASDSSTATTRKPKSVRA